MYADKMTDSMKEAIKETERRRSIQEKYNLDNGIVPKTIDKEIREVITNRVTENKSKVKKDKNQILSMIEEIEVAMKKAAGELDFERAMELRDALFELKSEL